MKGSKLCRSPAAASRRLDLVNLIIDHNLVATATKTFSPNLGGSLTLGNNLNSKHYKRLAEQGSVLIAPAPFQLNNTIPANTTSNEFESLIHTQAHFGQATLDVEVRPVPGEQVSSNNKASYTVTFQ